MHEDPDRPDITRLLREWQAGSATALERMIPLVYGEVHKLASRYPWASAAITPFRPRKPQR